MKETWDDDMQQNCVTPPYIFLLRSYYLMYAIISCLAPYILPLFLWFLILSSLHPLTFYENAFTQNDQH